MNATDLTIIYLSIGAPFGAFRYFYGSNGLGRRNISRSVAHVALWPIVLASALVTRIATGEPLRKPENSDVGDDYRHVGVRDLQRELEVLTLDSGNGLSLFVVREAIERYIALSRAVQGTEAPDPGLNKDLFSFGASKENDLGSICLSRRNLSRLRAHQSRARTDIAAIVERCSPLPRKQQALRTALTLMAELGDEIGIASLKNRTAVGGKAQGFSSDSFGARTPQAVTEI